MGKKMRNARPRLHRHQFSFFFFFFRKIRIGFSLLFHWRVNVVLDLSGNNFCLYKLLFLKVVEDKDRTIAKLEAEKFYLGERVFQLTGVEESFWNDEKLVRMTFHGHHFLYFSICGGEIKRDRIDDDDRKIWLWIIEKEKEGSSAPEGGSALLARYIIRHLRHCCVSVCRLGPRLLVLLFSRFLLFVCVDLFWFRPGLSFLSLSFTLFFLFYFGFCVLYIEGDKITRDAHLCVYKKKKQSSTDSAGRTCFFFSSFPP